jgi:uncharacterized membrane protein
MLFSVIEKFLSVDCENEKVKNRRNENMNFETSKNLAGIGAILLFVGILPYVNTYFVLPLAGLILLLIGLKGLSEYYNEAGIFNNALYGTIAAIVGIVIVGAIAIVALLGLFNVIYPSWNGDWTTLSSIVSQIDVNNITFSQISPYIGLFLLDYVLLFAFALVFGFLYRKSMNLLSTKSGVGLFGATGTVMLVGGVLTIVLIGYLLLWIAMLLFAIALFQAKPPMPPQTQQQTAIPQQYPTQV